MKYNLVKKLLLLSALLLSQSAEAMSRQSFNSPQKKALIQRIQQLKLQEDGTFSDSTLVENIKSFAAIEAISESPLFDETLNFISQPSTKSSQVRKSLDELYNRISRVASVGVPVFEDGYGVVKVFGHREASDALLIALLQKVINLKEKQELGI